MLATGLLLIATAFASVSDLRSRKIYNWTTYPSIVIAIFLNALGLFDGFPNEGAWSKASLGIVGLNECLLGLAVCGGLLLAGLILFNIGGGDVKLFIAIGAFLGTESGLEVLLWTFILGGVVGAVILIWRVGAVRLVRTYARWMWNLVVWRTRPEITSEEKLLFRSDLWLAPCAFAAIVFIKLNWLPVL